MSRRADRCATWIVIRGLKVWLVLLDVEWHAIWAASLLSVMVGRGNAEGWRWLRSHSARIERFHAAREWVSSRMH
jgi:hypothetical protein